MVAQYEYLYLYCVTVYVYSRLGEQAEGVICDTLS